MSDAPAEEQPHAILDESVPTTGLEAEGNQAADEFEAKAKAKAGAANSMYIRVRSPFKSYFDGDGFSISGLNATGPFDILPQHHNFISLLDPCELTIRSAKGEQKIQIAGGMMHVKADQVIVFLDV